MSGMYVEVYMNYNSVCFFTGCMQLLEGACDFFWHYSLSVMLFVTCWYIIISFLFPKYPVASIDYKEASVIALPFKGALNGCGLQIHVCRMLWYMNVSLLKFDFWTHACVMVLWIQPHTSVCTYVVRPYLHAYNISRLGH